MRFSNLYFIASDGYCLVKLELFVAGIFWEKVVSNIWITCSSKLIQSFLSHSHWTNKYTFTNSLSLLLSYSLCLFYSLTLSLFYSLTLSLTVSYSLSSLSLLHIRAYTHTHTLSLSLSLGCQHQHSQTKWIYFKILNSGSLNRPCHHIDLHNANISQHAFYIIVIIIKTEKAFCCLNQPRF